MASEMSKTIGLDSISPFSFQMPDDSVQANRPQCNIELYASSTLLIDVSGKSKNQLVFKDDSTYIDCY